MPAVGATDSGDHLLGEPGAVARVQWRADDPDDHVVAVELRYGDKGRIAERHEIASLPWTSRGLVQAPKRARKSTRSGSRSGVTAHWIKTPLGIRIRSAPLTSVV